MADDRRLSESAEALQAQLAELVRRSLVQLGDMDQIQVQIGRVSENLSKVTPPPAGPPVEAEDLK
jgi:hypothetical protein